MIRLFYGFWRRVTVFSILLLALTMPTTAMTADISAKERVLIINSYHQGYSWGDNEVAGILTALSAANIKTDAEIEYLDTKHLPKQEHFPQQMELFRAKFVNAPPDLVITLDDPAFDFAVTYRKKLFTDIPLVFIGLNNFNPSMLKGESNITGVVERQDFRGTVEAALALQPETKEVVVLHDYSPTGLATHREVSEQLAPLAGRVKIRDLPPMTINEVIAAINSLRPGSIVLAVSFGVDKAGKVFNHSELAKIISEKSPVPIYSTKIERLGYGIVGGSLMGGRTHGIEGGELAIKVLERQSALNIPIIENAKSELTFDYPQLVRFKIPLKRLPPGSKVINQPQSFYSQHRLVINVSAVIIGILLASLATVIVFNRRRLSAERALYEVKSYQTLFENASDPLFIINGDGRIIASSSVAQSLLHMTEQELTNRLFSTLLTDHDSSRLQEHLRKVTQDGKDIFTTIINEHSGTQIPVEISSRSITYKGEDVIFSAARDIGERLRLEQKLRELNAELEQRIKSRTVELEISNRDLASFCYAISHELRAPVARITGLSQALQEEINDNPADAEHCARRIIKASGELQQVIDSVLRLSRLAQSSFEPTSLNLSEIVQAAADRLLAENSDRNIELSIADNVTVNADPSLVKLCIENLLGNAFKYTSRQPSAKVEFGLDNATGALYVRDNGIGFEPSQASKLFEPFARLHPEDEFAGSGIGLATVQRIIERHGGKLWAEGAPGQGATIYFTLGS